MIPTKPKIKCKKTNFTLSNKHKNPLINEFCEIAGQENIIDERDLVKAFRSIDSNSNGYIDYREFMEIFSNVIINY